MENSKLTIEKLDKAAELMSKPMPPEPIDAYMWLLVNGLIEDEYKPGGE